MLQRIAKRAKTLAAATTYLLKHPKHITLLVNGSLRAKGNAFSGWKGKNWKWRLRNIAQLLEAEKRGWVLSGAYSQDLLLFEHRELKLKLAQPHAGVLDEDLTWWIPKKAEGTAVDIGGYFGETAVLLAKRGFKKVTIYEPVPENIEIIKLNAMLNRIEDRIDIVHAAASRSNGKLRIESSAPPGTAGFGLGGKNAKYVLEVPAIAWKKIIGRAIEEDATLIKVDCEGCERFLVQIPKEMLAKIPRWVIETHSKEIEETVFEKMLKVGFEAVESRELAPGIRLSIFKKVESNTIKKAPPCGIILLNYKTPKETAKALELAIQNLQTYEKLIFIVVNNSTGDGTEDEVKNIAKEHGLRLVKVPEVEIDQYVERDKQWGTIYYIPAKRNYGYARGNNLGIRLGARLGIKYFEILNPDARIPKNYVARKVEFATKNNCDITGSVIVNGSSVAKTYPIGVTKNVKAFQNKLCRNFAPLGAAIMLSREAVEKLGGFNEYTFLYSEEQIICEAIRKMGGKVCISPVRIYHKGGESTGKYSEATERNMWRSMQIYLAIHETPLHNIANATWAATVAIPRRALGVTIRTRSLRAGIKDAFWLYSGLLDGVKQAVKIYRERMRGIRMPGFPAKAKE